jgi:probable rRNA maturation factor
MTPTMTDPQLDLSIQFALKAEDLPRRADFRRWARAALMADAVVTLRIVDENEGRDLNREYRGKDYATNVLTFAYGAAADGAPLSGDIVICAPVVAREAAQQHIAITAHYAHLTLHGMLHLQGHDHETDADAAAMEAIESFIMRRLGFDDPYAEST